MSREFSGWATVVGTLVTLVLLVPGISMWNDAYTNADAAAGKCLVALGSAAAIVTFAFAMHLLGTRYAPEPDPGQDDPSSV